MSIESVAIALHHSRGRTASVRMVLVGIANHDGDGGAWPSIKTLSEYANLQARQVQNAITELEQLGEIRREVQAGGLANMASYDRPNLYHLQLRCPPHCDRSRAHKLVCERCGGELPKRPKYQTQRWHDDGDPKCKQPTGPTFDGPTDPVHHSAPGAPQCTPPVHHSAPKPSTNPTTHADKETHLPNRACARRAGKPHLIDTQTPYCMACGLDPLTGTYLTANGYRAS